jgi:hypothetical protein
MPSEWAFAYRGRIGINALHDRYGKVLLWRRDYLEDRAMTGSDR